MPRANAVSRFLGDRMQTRASFHRDRIQGFEIYTAGFSTTNLDDGMVRVEYLIQNRRYGRRLKTDETAGRVDRVKALARYTVLLSERWIVTEVRDGDWHYIVVR